MQHGVLLVARLSGLSWTLPSMPWRPGRSKESMRLESCNVAHATAVRVWYNDLTKETRMEIKLTYFEASSLRAQGFTLTQLSSGATSLHATESYWIARAEIEAWLRGLCNS